ncbi:MAG: hypothetical protein R3A48_10105 [Polyangiales bacterium]
MLDELSAARDSLQRLVAFDPALQGPLDLVAQAHTLVQEAARELGRYARGVRADPEASPRSKTSPEAQPAQGTAPPSKRSSRFALVRRSSWRTSSRARRGGVARGRGRGAQLAAREARALSAARREAAGRLGESISRELASLSMGGARVVVDVAHTSPASAELNVDGARLLPSGIDRVEFLIAPNRGEEPRPLRRIASGGELSRALLAIKRVLTDVANETFYVFDEVDAGVGGAVAEVIGQKIKEVARRNQVLCITHLPQIAAYGDRHLVVRKLEAGDRTASSITELDEPARLEEIARMLGGIRITERTREVAAEMIRGAEGATV